MAQSLVFYPVIRFSFECFFLLWTLRTSSWCRLRDGCARRSVNYAWPMAAGPQSPRKPQSQHRGSLPKGPLRTSYRDGDETEGYTHAHTHTPWSHCPPGPKQLMSRSMWKIIIIPLQIMITIKLQIRAIKDRPQLPNEARPPLHARTHTLLLT